MLAARSEPTTAFAQADLRLPADSLNRFRQRVNPRLDVLRDFRRMPICPCRFDQRAPGTTVPRFGDAALSTGRAAGILRGNQPDEGRQLPRRVEAGEVPQFGDDRDGDQPLHAAERLQRLHDGIQAPRRPDLPQFGFESPESVDLFIDRAQRFLEDNLLRGRGTDDLGEVPAMGGVPVGPADVVQPERGAGRTSGAASRSSA